MHYTKLLFLLPAFFIAACGDANLFSDHNDGVFIRFHNTLDQDINDGVYSYSEETSFGDIPANSYSEYYLVEKVRGVDASPLGVFRGSINAEPMSASGWVKCLTGATITQLEPGFHTIAIKEWDYLDYYKLEFE